MNDLGVNLLPPRHAVGGVRSDPLVPDLWGFSAGSCAFLNGRRARRYVGRYLPTAPLCKVNFCALQLASVPKSQDDLDYFYRMNTRLDEMGLEFNFQWNLVHSTVSSSFFRRSDWMDSAASASAIRYYVLYSRPYSRPYSTNRRYNSQIKWNEIQLNAGWQHSSVTRVWEQFGRYSV